jgi:hypothetical protein
MGLTALLKLLAAPARHRMSLQFQAASKPAARGVCIAPDHLGRQSFSTCPNSSSTGVARPKIVTDTRNRLFS